MPAPADIAPQTPGEAPTTPQEPTRLEVIAAGDLDSILAIVPELNLQELHDLQDLELAGEKRDGVLLAIADELDARALLIQPDPPTPPSEATAPDRGDLLSNAALAAHTRAVAAAHDQPIRVDTQPFPVLTDNGWLVPEPMPGATSKAN